MKIKSILFLTVFLLVQFCCVFSYENSPNSNSKNSRPQAEIHINSQRGTSSKNSWHFSTHVREIPNNSNMQRADYSVVTHGSVELQNYFHQTIMPLIYDATVHNHYCVIPGYVSPDGLRGCINKLSQFSGLDAALVSDLKNRLETYCNRIEDIVLRGKAYEFCETLSQAQQTALLKVYADFLKEFYTNAASHIFYNHSQQNVLMQRIMPTINWDYYDGSTVKHRSKRLQQQRASSVNGKLGAMYKALHEGDFAKAYNIGREQVTTVVGKSTEQTSVFEHYPALQQKIESAYTAHKSQYEQDHIALEQVATVQTECSNHVLQKLHLDALQQRYDAATRAILNSKSVQLIHKITPLQATCFDTDYLTPDQKGILFTGNQLQHHLVDEAITVVDTVVCGDLNEKVGDAALGLVNTSVSLNKSGDVVMAARTLDACWALVDFAKEAARYSYSVLSTHVPPIAKGACDGVCESLHGAVHMVCHPVEAAQDVVNSFVVAGYCLGKLAYTSCVLEAANDLLDTNFAQYDQIIQHYGIDPEALVAVYKHAKENVTTEDVARVGTKVVVDMMLLHGITKAVSAIAQESLPAFISCMRKGGESAKVAMTAEGVPVRCGEEVACLMESIQNSSNSIKVVKEIAKEAPELIKTFNIAKYDASIGDLKKLEQAIEKLKDIQGALTKDGPLFKVLEYGQKAEVLTDARKIAEINGRLQTARGAMYEIEKALELMDVGEEVIELGEIFLNRELDISTKIKIIECKNIDWGKCIGSRAEKMKSDLGEWKKIAQNNGKIFELHSKNPIPQVWKDVCIKMGIKFVEG